MKVWGLWYGGSSYSVGSVKDDTEEFRSLKHAKNAFQSRADYDPYFPCVEQNETEMSVWFYDPTDIRDPYPDRILKLGPHGGVRVERC